MVWSSSLNSSAWWPPRCRKMRSVYSSFSSSSSLSSLTSPSQLLNKEIQRNRQHYQIIPKIIISFIFLWVAVVSQESCTDANLAKLHQKQHQKKCIQKVLLFCWNCKRLGFIGEIFWSTFKATERDDFIPMCFRVFRDDREHAVGWGQWLFLIDVCFLNYMVVEDFFRAGKIVQV